MKMFRVPLAVIAATLAVAALAAEPPKPAMREELVQKTATVESVDQSTRQVTLRLEDGKTSTIVAGPEVRNLAQVKAGDKVVVSYYQALAAEVKKPGEGVEGVEADVSTTRAELGAKPAAGAGVLLRTTVTIESVDPTANTVTFTRSDGTSRTVTIQTPEGKEFVTRSQEGRPGRDRLHRGAGRRSEAGRLSRFAGSRT